MAKYFVGGIDTNIGKTVATGWLARERIGKLGSAITQKLVQTGCTGISEDILAHRKIMGTGLFPEDEDFTTCRYVAKYPASPHLAFAMENRRLDLGLLAADTDKLEKKYGTVYVEGAGGLMVPLTRDYLTIDYVADNELPLILVVSSRLGSLNQALMTLEVCRARGIETCAIVYNTYPAAPSEIEESTREYLRAYLKKNTPTAEFLEIAKL